MPLFRQRFTYRDDRGQTATIGTYLSADTLAHANTYAAALSPLISACIAAALQSANGPYFVQNTLTYGTSPGGDILVPIEDKLVLSAQCANAQPWRLSLPSPLETCFLADGETGDAAQADVAALVSYLTVDDANGARACNLAASKVNLVYGLSRVRRRVRRRFNLITKNPLLTGPGL